MIICRFTPTEAAVSPLAYTVLHVGAVMLMYMALGGLAVLAAWAGTLEADSEATANTRSLRRFLIILHGTALLIIFVAGFGLLAKKLGIGGPGEWPTYVWLKIVLWLILGGSTVLLRKQPGLLRPMMVILPALGLLSGYVALFKPF